MSMHCVLKHSTIREKMEKTANLSDLDKVQIIIACDWKCRYRKRRVSWDFYRRAHMESDI